MEVGVILEVVGLYWKDDEEMMTRYKQGREQKCGEAGTVGWSEQQT